jgi:hypothetical protein
VPDTLRVRTFTGASWLIVVGPQALITNASMATAAIIMDLVFIFINSLFERNLLMVSMTMDDAKSSRGGAVL